MRSRVTLAIVSFLAALGLAAGVMKFSQPAPVDPAVLAAGGTRTGAPAPASPTCAGNPVVFGPDIPPDFAQSTQQQIDCFAWSEFVSLNWPASVLDGGTSGGFGTPGDLDPVQWETYMLADSLFPPDGGMPPPWGAQAELTGDCLDEVGLTREQASRLLPLMTTSKFSSRFSPGDSKQAFPFNAPSWLGAKNGTNVWYEVRVSQPEYGFVVQNGFYNANAQAASVDAGMAFVLPQGSLQDGGIGAIELKAAWMEVTDPQNPKWSRYKVTAAVVPDPVTQKCRATEVALVGLHIIHKTANQPTWIWATFEHVDNAPVNGADAGTTDWNFFDPACQPKTFDNVSAACTVDGGTSVTVPCAPNQPPPYYLGQGCPPPAPVQVTRVNRLDSTAQSVNQVMQPAIASAYPGSVWQNYQLINVLWSTNPTSVPTGPVQVPLAFQSPQPSASTPIVNTTMETYIQTIPGNPFQPSNCIVCHDGATIASTAALPNPTWSSDFSFVFGDATAPPGVTAPVRKSLKRVPGPVVHPTRMRRIIR